MDAGADVLLAGPRGRRLCLELAMELDPLIRSAVFPLAYSLDRGAGTSRVVLSCGEDDGALPEPSLAELLTGLNSLDVTRTRADLIDAALIQAVNTSRPWQEPDGEEGLAALPEVTAALAPLARQVMTAHSAQWWDQDRATGQWSIDWRPADDPALLPRDAAQTLSAWARGTRAEEARAEKDRPQDPTANWSGTWWSIPQGTLQTVAQIPLGLDLIEDSFGEQSATVIPVRGAGQTYEVRSGSDWVSLCRDYPLMVTASRRHDWFHCTGRNGAWVIPDWERVSERWDAVHVSALAYLSSANLALAVDGETSTVLAGWNPDTTIWLTDAAREWEGPRQYWRRPGIGETWTRSLD